MKRDLLDLSSLTTAELDGLLRLGIRLKAELKSGLEHPYLRGKTLAMIFQKPSLRTRITFETGMAQLGGHAIYLAPQDIGIGERGSADRTQSFIPHEQTVANSKPVADVGEAVSLTRLCTLPIADMEGCCLVVARRQSRAHARIHPATQ